MNSLGQPIPREWIEGRADQRQIVNLLHTDRGTSELELKAILMNEYGWTAERVHDAVSRAQIANTIRWVAFDGWYRGGRPV